ncbi:sodium:solute symporter family protein, partial [bacterium]|nr:sodium:solute symporter family protein [bacterium]
GFRSVVFSDLIQFFVMCLSVFLVIAFSAYEFGGLNFLKTNLDPSYFSLTGSSSISETLVWGLIALSTLVDPNFYQRCFAVKNKATAKWGIVISIGIWVCFDLCTTFGAMYAKAIIPNADSSSAYLNYAVQLLPSGMRGFVLAGILATIISTLDSYLFLAGTSLSYDLAPKKWRGRVSNHYISIILVGLVSIIFASYFKGNIKTVWKTLGSYSSACLLFPVVFAYFFPKRIGDKAFVTASLSSAFCVTVWRSIELKGFLANVDELYIGLLCSATILMLSIIKKNKTSAS